MAKSRICSVDDCDKSVFARGWCWSHYTKLRGKLCSIEGCGKPVKTRGHCIMHDKRMQKHGDPHFKQQPRLEWLENHASYQGDDCIIWPFGRSDKGYAVLKQLGRASYGHQVMCRMVHGPAPKGREDVLHSCRNPACVAPKHLRWGSHTENMGDRIADGTSNRGERNSWAKLTADEVLLIRRMPGFTANELGDMFGVTPMTIYDIRQRRTWAWLTD